ncbi:MAG: hypothetical protein ACKOWQ_09285 [Aquirufa sp.]
MPKFFLLLFLVFPFFGNSQTKTKIHKKGSFYVHWGYNRSNYANSDIKFVGPGYDFTLSKVQSTDMPTTFDGFTTYLNPSLFSIPQFNFHGGYFLKDNLSISIGWDHMKYVMEPDQDSHISGFISTQVSNPAFAVNPAYAKQYSSNTPFRINSEDFLQFEHTDGFNYASIELEHYQNLWKSQKGQFQLDWINGGGIGLMVPRSDVRLFTIGKNNLWNIAGAGASIKTGLRLNLTKLLFFETTVKGGYTNLWDIRTTGRSVDHAEQAVWFGEFYGALGFSIR